MNHFGLILNLINYGFDDVTGGISLKITSKLLIRSEASALIGGWGKIFRKFCQNVGQMDLAWRIVSSTSDMTLTWYYGKQKTLLVQVKAGYELKEALIKVCTEKSFQLIMQTVVQ